MDVLRFNSDDGYVSITASTGADMLANWTRFRSRVSNDSAATYCDYRSTQSGKLSLYRPDARTLSLVDEHSASVWAELPPVFYETSVYNVSVQIEDSSSEPIILHKLKEVTELFTSIRLGGNRWLLTAPLSFLNEPGIFELSFKYKPSGKSERTDTFSFRVVSPKLDTKADYNHILAEINEQYNEIVFNAYIAKLAVWRPE
jgi:hypothetical protein